MVADCGLGSTLTPFVWQGCCVLVDDSFGCGLNIFVVLPFVCGSLLIWSKLVFTRHQNRKNFSVGYPGVEPG
jgi:hypothetical protein